MDIPFLLSHDKGAYWRTFLVGYGGSMKTPWWKVFFIDVDIFWWYPWRFKGGHFSILMLTCFRTIHKFLRAEVFLYWCQHILVSKLPSRTPKMSWHPYTWLFFDATTKICSHQYINTNRRIKRGVHGTLNIYKKFISLEEEKEEESISSEEVEEEEISLEVVVV